MARNSGSGSAKGDNNGYAQSLVNPLESEACSAILSFLGFPCRLIDLSRQQLGIACGAGALVAGFFIYQVVVCDLAALCHRLNAFFLPLFALVCAYNWLALAYRRTWSSASIYTLFCACYVGEALGQGLRPEEPKTQLFSANTLHLLPLIVTLSLASYFSSLPNACHRVFLFVFVVLSRSVACVHLADWPPAHRPFVAYTCGVFGIFAAKYMETALRSGAASSSGPMTSDGKGRRRRTSSAANAQGAYSQKARRTSLPALGMQKNHLQGNQQSGMSALDIALLSEAHGLVTDMLADTSLPLHIVSALRALSNLLSPPNNAFTHVQRPRISGISALTADLNNGSDTEEIPVMGEKLSALPKKFRRNLPPSLFRRMSTSTWTTTTSATGMPTLEPEPCRKRSTSFRNAPDLIMSSSPTSQLLSVDNYSGRIASSKYRSYSTTSLVQTPFPHHRLVRERKTVCSLHPLTASDINRLHCLSNAAIAAAASDHEGGGPGYYGISDAVSSGGEDDDDRRSFSGGNISDGGGGGGVGGLLGFSSGETSPSAPCLSPSTHSIPAIRRVINPSSDYESSESPSNSENSLNSGVAQSTESATCILTESRESISFIIGQSPEVSPLLEKVAHDLLVESGDRRIVYVNDGTRYDLERLADDPLLERIHEWDYPIFDLNTFSPECILSQICYRIFLEVGLFQTFRIPIQEFLAYFHALESGYREKPYHNRMHAADVLHAVYYLTSQPIPGFTQLPLEVESPPTVQKSEAGSNSSGLVQRQSFNAEDTYGVLGANLPALELMALYTASAMHDYDHPGRTNAFLVTTYAPEAVLYNDRSVLENHHAAAAWSLFLSKPDYNFLCHLDKAEFKRFRFLVIEAILATDLKRHFEILAEFNAKVNDVDAAGIDWNSETDRLLAMEMCIKLADINGPCKRHDIHVQWTTRIADEFYEQGDEEASLGLPISPFMDRCNPQLAKLQESFINHLVAPLCTSYGAAGLLPGQWIQGNESEDEVAVTVECKTVDDDRSNISRDSRQGKALKDTSRKITCLQTQHLKENHDYWVVIIKEEQRQSDSCDRSPEVGSCARSPQSDTDSSDLPNDEMETIHEEGVQVERGAGSPTDSL